MSASSVPRVLIDRRQWVCWRNVIRDGKSTKVPFQPSGVPASTTNPDHWSSLEQCQSVVANYAGLGFVFTADDPFIGIDLDGCRNPDTGELAPWATAIVERFETYCEISPSQTGVKLFALTGSTWNCKHTLDLDYPGHGGKRAGIEVYQTGRYFAVTGNVLNGTSEVLSCDDALAWLAEEFFITEEKPTSKLTSSMHATTRNGNDNRSKIAMQAMLKIAIPAKENDGSSRLVKCCRQCVRAGLSESEATNAIRTYAAVCPFPKVWTDNEISNRYGGIDAKLFGDAVSDSSGVCIDAIIGDGEKRVPPVGVADDTEIQQCLACGNVLPVGCKRCECGFELAPAKEKRGFYDLRVSSGRTDQANAVRFVDAHHADLLYVAPWHKWLAWDGSRWAEDSGVGAMQCAKSYAKSLWQEFARVVESCDNEEIKKLITFSRSPNKRKSIDDFMKLAGTDSRVVCDVESLNSDPLLLNCENGTVDLRDGKLRPHSQADRITQRANVNYVPDAQCPQWLSTLDLVFNGDAELIRYVQQLLGYSLSGDTGEHILPIAYGNGCNGKSTIWNCVAELLGDYATLACDDLLLGNKSNHPTEKASLYQKRFVAISEPEKKSSLRESRVKELTGDRLITARRMHEDFWSFERTHTFWLSTNHLPRIDGTDEGIWRRVKLIPFTIDIREKTKPIPNFDRWLVENEGAGILAWLLRGFLDWQANGLIEPAAVTTATRGYRADSDALGEFISEHCIVAKNAVALAADLYKTYSEIWGGNWSKTAFGKAMAERFEKERPDSGPHRKQTIYRGVGLLSTGFEKPNENKGCPQLPTPKTIAPRETSFSMAQPVELWATMGKVCECGSEMTPAEPINGWRNWDCPQCGKVIPAKVEK